MKNSKKTNVPNKSTILAIATLPVKCMQAYCMATIAGMLSVGGNSERSYDVCQKSNKAIQEAWCSTEQLNECNFVTASTFASVFITLVEFYKSAITMYVPDPIDDDEHQDLMKNIKPVNMSALAKSAFQGIVSMVDGQTDVKSLCAFLNEHCSKFNELLITNIRSPGNDENACRYIEVFSNLLEQMRTCTRKLMDVENIIITSSDDTDHIEEISCEDLVPKENDIEFANEVYEYASAFTNGFNSIMKLVIFCKYYELYINKPSITISMNGEKCSVNFTHMAKLFQKHTNMQTYKYNQFMHRKHTNMINFCPISRKFCSEK